METSGLSNDEFERRVDTIDAEIAMFTKGMRSKMLKNVHKEDQDTAPTELLLGRFHLEIEEFKLAYDFERPEDAVKELYDIANFAMILARRIRRDGNARFRSDRRKPDATTDTRDRP